MFGILKKSSNFANEIINQLKQTIMTQTQTNEMSAIDKYNVGFYTFRQLLNESSLEEQRRLTERMIERKFAEMHKAIDECKKQILNELFR